MTLVKVVNQQNVQSVPIPREYQLESEEVFLYKVGNVVMLIPKENAWVPLLRSLNQFSADFMQEREQLPLESRETF